MFTLSKTHQSVAVEISEALPAGVPSHLLVAEARGDDPSGQREEANAWPSGWVGALRWRWWRFDGLC